MCNNIRLFFFIHAAGFVLLLVRSATAAEFAGLGDLLGGAFQSEAYGVSDDGLVVVGGSFVGSGYSSVRPFRWTQETGMARMGGIGYSVAHDTSADGSVVVGRTDRGAFRWVENVSMTNLGSLGGGPAGSANGVSADGSVVVGRAMNPSNHEAFRWTEPDGMAGLGTLAVGRSSFAHAVSADGSTVVGYATTNGSTPWGNIKEAFRWTEAGGIEGLGHLPGDDTPSSWAEDVSDDGAVIVGVANARADFTFGQAFRWTEPTGMVSLGSIPGGPPLSVAHGVSGDGSRVVGLAFNNPQAGTEAAFLWDEKNGMRNLQQVLTDQFDLEASLQGWTLEFANDISADGRVIVGFGTNPSGQTEAWRVTLALSADFDGDGDVDGDDFLAWQTGFGTQSGAQKPNGDYDNDGDVDGDDFLGWQAEFGLGSGSASATVPETASIVLALVIATVGAVLRPNRFGQRIRSL